MPWLGSPRMLNIFSLIATKLVCKNDGEVGSRGYVLVTSTDSWRMRGIEAVGTVELTYVGRLLRMGGDSLLVTVFFFFFSISDCLEISWRWVHWQRESDVWLVRAGTWRPGNLHRSRPSITNIMQIAHDFFTSPQGLTSAFNFYSHFPHSFLLCLPLHSHFVFVWFFLPFSLLSSKFMVLLAHVAS